MKRLASTGLALLLSACNAAGISPGVSHSGQGLSAAREASEDTYKVVYSFVGPPTDGSYPTSGLLMRSGKLYGTTDYGAKRRVHCNRSTKCGTVYELTPGSSNDTVLYTFAGPPSDGVAPVSMISANGVFYGATQFGGTFNYGTIFELSPSPRNPGRWTETILYSFKGPPSDGDDVDGSLLIDSAGALYGVTFMGGSATTCFFKADGCGTIFKLAPPAPGQKAWKESVLHSFTGVPDGAAPHGLVWDGATIYGTTAYGGSSTQCPYLDGCGTLYSLLKSGHKGAWTETVVHSFNVSGSSQPDGSLPSGALVAGKDGTIYGTTEFGGGMGPCDVEKGLMGCGTLYAFSPSMRGRTSSNVSILYAFKGAPLDGATPFSIILNGTRGVYGVTTSGGNGACSAYEGCGTIYELKRPSDGSKPWKERLLHSFEGGPTDGYSPGGTLVFHDATLYGVTDLGGSGPCAFGCGTVYALQP